MSTRVEALLEKGKSMGPVTDPTQVGWIAKCVGESVKASTIDPEVAVVIEAELRGRMQERAIRSAQLDELARSLIAIVNRGSTAGLHP